MAIPKKVVEQFDLLLEMAKDGHLSLMECTHSETKETKYVVCGAIMDGDNYVFLPFGDISGEFRFTEYVPPDTEEDDKD